MFPEIAAAGASLLAISPGKPEYLRQTIEKHRLKFEVLSDAGNSVASRYGLVFTMDAAVRDVYLNKLGIDLSKFNADESWTLPIPARFVLDRAGVIRWAESHPDYTKRPEPAETVETLRAIAK